MNNKRKMKNKIRKKKTNKITRAEKAGGRVLASQA
jgi:hypothetical protein